MAGLAAGVFVEEDVDEADIEKLKHGDMLESSFGEFAKETPQLYEAVIAERDRYMAAKLREAGAAGQAKEVLAVVGAGHLKGLAAALSTSNDDPARTTRLLDQVPPGSKVPWFTLIFATSLLAIFGWGFWHGGFDLGAKLVLDWTLITAAGGALGCLAAGGHPLSILAAAGVSPVTPRIPALSSGMVSAFIEAWLRKPTYQDMLDLRHDTGTLRGWWHNRFARVIVNFVLTNSGTALAVYIAGAKLVHGLG
jgi:pheromone shutdown protein TraB